MPLSAALRRDDVMCCAVLLQGHGEKHGRRPDLVDMQHVHRGAACLFGRDRGGRNLAQGECWVLVCMYACMYDLLLALCGQSTALELDYFNKQVQVKDSDTVSGGEGAGEGAEGPRGSGNGSGSGSHSKRQRDLEAQQAEEARRLGVDKGLFRRKPQPANAPSIFASKSKGKGKGGGRSRNSSDDEEEGRDIEAGPGSAGRGGAGNGRNFFSFSFGSDRQHVHPQSAKKSSQSMAGLIAEEPEATPLHAEDGPPAGHRPSPGPGPRHSQGDAEAAGAEGAVDAGPEGAERAPGREQRRLIR